VYVFLYGRLYLVLSGLDEALATGKKFIHNQPIQIALVSVFCATGVLDGTAYDDGNWVRERIQNSTE
jgi:hypothetical protein